MRDVSKFNEAVRKALQEAGAAIAEAAGPEEAIAAITRIEIGVLGDREAWRRPGNLKEGEREQYACGGFFLLPEGAKAVLIGPQNYGPDQTHIIIDSDLGHPGWVVKNKRPLLLENTEEHQSFVRILATFRAGSVVYCPLMWKGTMLGVLLCAAQTRNAMTADDLEAQIAFGHLAAAAWVAHDGPSFVRRFEA